MGNQNWHRSAIGRQTVASNPSWGTRTTMPGRSAVCAKPFQPLMEDQNRLSRTVRRMTPDTSIDRRPAGFDVYCQIAGVYPPPSADPDCQPGYVPTPPQKRRMIHASLLRSLGTGKPSSISSVGHHPLPSPDSTSNPSWGTRTHRRRTSHPAVELLPTPRSEEHTSELQSLMRLSYAVFCLKKKNNNCT